MKLLLTRYYDIQRTLDERIIKKFNLPQKLEVSIFRKRVIALIVEVSETMNDWRGFKFWSENQEPKPTLLEEYVDGLHFVLSLGIQIGEVEHMPLFPSEEVTKETTVEESFLVVTHMATLLLEDNYYASLLQAYMDFGYLLGFTWEDITEAYVVKNQTNHHRQDNGY